MDAYDISASALTAQRLRLDTIASNLANINTTRKADGTLGAYRRRNVVFASMMQEKMGFANSIPLKGSSLMSNGPAEMAMENGAPVLKASLTDTVGSPGAGVKVVQIVEDQNTPLRRVYEPNNPDADDKGFVEYPNINPVTEMVDMISATRAYEANVTALQNTKTIAKAALEI